MALLKCKMCGQDIEVQQGAASCRCPACGTKQTVPPTDSARMVERYMQANRLRRAADFDAAFDVYQSILVYSPSDAEAWWGKCLCRYGIDYVTNAETGEKKPTCHRTLTTSIFEDEDYKKCIECADPVARQMYADEAAEIDRVQKGILTIAQKEQPYDVFICYKEKDPDTDERTQDSVLAQEIYYALTEKGYKVFFARVTLEHKLGEEYEPLIYAALSTARVMLVLGTKPEYMTAPWVRNEWSRFLAMSKGDPNRLIIPCYRDMDPYDLPEALAPLQSQNMAKIGFLQDLLHGIGKVMGKGAETAASGGSASRTGAMTERAFILLKDEQFEEADRLLNQLLTSDPHSARGYLGKLMVLRRAATPEALAGSKVPLTYSKSYQHALEYGDETLKKQLNGYSRQVDEGVEERLTAAYRQMAACQFAGAVPALDGLIDDLCPDAASKKFSPAFLADIKLPTTNPLLSRARVGKLMAERNVNFPQKLANETEPLEKSPFFSAAFSCADGETRAQLTAWRDQAQRNHEAKLAEQTRQKQEAERQAEEKRRENTRNRIADELSKPNSCTALRRLNSQISGLQNTIKEKREKDIPEAVKTLKSEKKALRKYNWQAAGSILLGLACLALSIVLIRGIVVKAQEGSVWGPIWRVPVLILTGVFSYAAIGGALITEKPRGKFFSDQEIGIERARKKKSCEDLMSRIAAHERSAQACTDLLPQLEQEYKRLDEERTELRKRAQMKDYEDLNQFDSECSKFRSVIPASTEALLKAAEDARK